MQAEIDSLRCCYYCKAAEQMPDGSYRCHRPEVKAAMKEKGVARLDKAKMGRECPFFTDRVRDFSRAKPESQKQQLELL